MPEQAARSRAGSGAMPTRGQDRHLRHAADLHRAHQANRPTPRERNRRALPDDFPGSERAGLAPTPRTTIVIRGQVADRYTRTIVIRGQVADRYTTRRYPSGSRPISWSYGPRMRPDRAALWAVLLGLALVIAAFASAHM